MSFFIFPNLSVRRCGLLLLTASLFLLSPPFLSAEDDNDPAGETSAEEPANGGKERSFRIRGYGFWNNLQLRRTLNLISDTEDSDSFPFTFIEDSVLILLNQLFQDGYLRPTVEVTLVTPEGETKSFSWDHEFSTLLPPDLEARTIEFRLHPGVLFFFDELTFAGLSDSLDREVMEETEARAFFLVEGFIFGRRASRKYTPRGFEQGQNNLREIFQRRGYLNAQVRGEILSLDEESGRVNARVVVQSGPRHMVRHLREKVFLDGMTEKSSLEKFQPDVPYSRLWAQDKQVELRNMFFRQGYPRASSQIRIDQQEMVDGEMMVDVTAIVRTGTQVDVKEVRFSGQDRTRLAPMQRRVPVTAGEPLDRMAAERGRQRLAGMGSFDRVSLSYIEEEEDSWVVLYEVEEGKKIDLSVLLGFGTYELLRGGFEVNQYNLFGRGHRARLQVTQSFKASAADYTYSIPELFGERVSGFGRISALRREELDFTREEIGLSTGVRRSFENLGVDMSLRYGFSFLQSRNLQEEQTFGRATSRVGAITWDVRRDRRNNPIYPRRGYQLASGLETAAEVLGGQAEYLRWELDGSLHRPLGPGRTLHLGFTHGLINPFGEDEDKLPFNKRFFPGGDNSQRGYRFGQAASRGPGGAIIGSEAYFLLQTELEQALADQLFAVLFFDQIWFSQDLSDYLSDDILRTLGIGLRYETIVGPIRLEYGYNIERRPEDPSGTIHLSIGFPF